MKRKIYLLFSLLLAVTIGHSQNAQLNIRFANPQVISGSPDVLSFDMEVAANQAGTGYATIQTLLVYNEAAFGSNIASSMTITLVDNFVTYFPTGKSNQTSNSVLFAASKFPPTWPNATVLTTGVYERVLNYQIPIVDNSELAGIEFNISLMGTQNQYVTASSPINPVPYTIIFDNDLLNFPLSSSLGPPELIISEVADPEAPDDDARFVEIYNPTSSEYDFSAWDMWLSRRVDGGSTVHSVQLSGNLPAGGTFVVAANGTQFNAKYGAAADQVDADVADGDGNDAYFLSVNGDINSETPFDVYGVDNTNGTGTAWEYTDTKAVRKFDVVAPNPTFDITEWVIGPKDPNNVGSGTLVSYAGDMTPGSHRESLEWDGGGTSTSWRDKDNWNPDYVPDAAHNVYVAAGNSVSVNDTTYGFCNDLNLTDPPVGPGPENQFPGIESGNGSVTPMGEIHLLNNSGIQD